LKYLKIGGWDGNNFTQDILSRFSHVNAAIHLTHLTIGFFSYADDSLEMVFIFNRALHMHKHVHIDTFETMGPTGGSHYIFF
jgi:hypothetical protein